MSKNGAVIGVSDHGGWAVLVTVGRDGSLLDRRRVELVDDHLPSIPHHHEAQLLPIEEGIVLVERVRASAQRHAAIVLETVAQAVPHIVGVALRVCPNLPPTIGERITDYRSRNVADWVMYRQALAAAAEARGWMVYWYESKTVTSSASNALGSDFEARFTRMRSEIGPPWNNDHKLAMAAAIAAATRI